MSREDEIIDKAIEIEDKMNEEGMCISWALHEMAKWCDNYPHPAYRHFIERIEELERQLNAEITGEQ